MHFGTAHYLMFCLFTYSTPPFWLAAGSPGHRMLQLASGSTAVTEVKALLGGIFSWNVIYGWWSATNRKPGIFTLTASATGLRPVAGKLFGNRGLLQLISFRVCDDAGCCTCSEALAKLLQWKGWVETRGTKVAGMAEWDVPKGPTEN